MRDLRSELADLRDKVTSFYQSLLERKVDLEATLHPIVGNGQPRRLATMDTRMTSLERNRWKWSRIAASSGLVAGFIFDLLKKTWFGF